MHWRRLNLNELNGELKSLGGFFACFSLFARWTDAKKLKKHNQPLTTHNQPLQPNQCQIRKSFVFPPSPGGRLSKPNSFPGQSLGGVAKPTHPQPGGPLTSFLANSLLVLSLLGRRLVGGRVMSITTFGRLQQ